MTVIKKANIKIESHENGNYRYLMKRNWAEDGIAKKTLVAIMHNPNVASEVKGDKSSNLCMNKAVDLQCNEINIVNLYAERTKKSEDLVANSKKYDEINFNYLARAVNSADVLLVAWGDKPGEMVKHPKFEALLKNFDGKVVCFGLNKTGEPKHPALTGEDTKLEEFGVIEYYK